MADINKEFVVIRGDTKTISQQIQLLLGEQRQFLQWQQLRDKDLLEKTAKENVDKKNAKNSTNSESWIYWIARKTYVVSVYKYFYSKT